jgi:hypothetical protein
MNELTASVNAEHLPFYITAPGETDILFILVPSSSGRGRFQAGFRQISAPVLKVGMITGITCASKSLTVIPMVVTEIQGSIASGQLRPTDQLIDIQDRIQAILLPIRVLVFPS